MSGKINILKIVRDASNELSDAHQQGKCNMGWSACNCYRARLLRRMGKALTQMRRDA